MNGMSVVKIVEGMKIYYSSFFEQFIVLFPKGDGSSQMGRFHSSEEAESSIQRKVANHQDSKKFWWMQDD